MVIAKDYSQTMLTRNINFAGMISPLKYGKAFWDNEKEVWKIPIFTEFGRLITHGILTQDSAEIESVYPDFMEELERVLGQ